LVHPLGLLEICGWNNRRLIHTHFWKL
jgi:hypothetical protein